MEKRDKLLNILKYTALGLLGALLIVLIFSNVRQKSNSAALEKYLQEQFEQYQAEVEEWKDRYESVFSEKTVLLSNVDSLESEIKKLRKTYDQKVVIVKSYSNPELEQFFSDRYRN